MLRHVRFARSSIAGRSSCGNAIRRLSITSLAFEERGPSAPTTNRPIRAARFGDIARNDHQNRCTMNDSIWNSTTRNHA
jgi:hypothetical protein